MERKTFERALHAWDDWHDSIKRSREMLGYDPKWPIENCIDWIEKHYSVIREQAESQLQLLELAPTLREYWEDCFYSDYQDKDGNVNLKKITRCLSEHKSLPDLPCDQRIAWYEDEDIHAPWIRIEIWIHSKFATKELFNYSSIHAFRTLESELSWRKVEPHPVAQWLKGGRPPVDDDLALECVRLIDEEGWTEVKIGKKYRWALQEDNYGKLTQCRTARRYIKRGRELKKRRWT